MMGFLNNCSKKKKKHSWESSVNTGEATALALEALSFTRLSFFVKKEGFVHAGKKQQRTSAWKRQCVIVFLWVH